MVNNQFQRHIPKVAGTTDKWPRRFDIERRALLEGATHRILTIMGSRLLEKLEGSWQSFSRLHIALRIPLFILFWPFLIGLYIFSENRNTKVNIAALIALTLLLQLPWLNALAEKSQLNRITPSIKSVDLPFSGSGNSGSAIPEPTVSPVVSISYGAVTTGCSGYFMTGTLEVTNNGNTPISGRAEIPVFTYEKFMVPLSGIFLNVPPDSTTVISLEGGEGCKKGQTLGAPTTVFTIPSQDGLKTINQFGAFEWSAVTASCDKGAGFIKLVATARNTSEYELTAGIEARVTNGPLSQGQINAGVQGTAFFGTIYKLAPGQSRVINFGYGGYCVKGQKGDDGPYSTEFEVRFTY